jgi:stress-induced morphogen
LAALWRDAAAICYDPIDTLLLGTNSAMPMDAKEIETLIHAKFPDAVVEIKDLAGDGDHYAAHVVASAFVGKSRVQQHQMVYEALGGRMGGVLHALALTTSAPKT